MNANDKRSRQVGLFLQQHYADIFDAARPTPLAIGIYGEIRTALPEIPARPLKGFLFYWCHRTPYLQAVENGLERRHLDGTVADIQTHA